jgi:hypothetical protein
MEMLITNCQYRGVELGNVIFAGLDKLLTTSD